MKEYKAPDKVTQKMTREGVVVENRSTSEAEFISSRTDGESITAGKVLDWTYAIHTLRKFKKAAKKTQDTVNQGMDTIKHPSSRLQFTEEERETPELQKAIRKSDKAADKLDVAREAVPKKKKVIRERTFDEALGKGKTRLRFKETEKPIKGKAYSNLLAHPVQEARAQLHSKIREVEKENVGVECGHAVEQLGEKAASKGCRLAKDGIRHHKLKPYRAAAKAEHFAIKANADFLYQKALHDNPALAASNPVSRYWQKQQIKRNYAKQIRDTGKTVKQTGGSVKSAAVKAKEAAQKAAGFVRRHWKGLAALLVLGLMVMFLMGSLQSCSSLFGGGFSSVVGSSYLSEETEMLAAEASYAAMEAELQYEVDNYESLHPGFDEYIYHLDGVYHDPHELAAYLTAKYVTYTASGIQAELQQIFGLQYELSTAERTETRYRTETHYDPDTGQSYTVRVPYEYKIITITLTNSGLFSVAQSQLTDEEFQMYQIYRETLGNMPLLFGGGSTDTRPGTDLSGVQFVDGTRPGNPVVVDIAESQVGNVGGYPYWSWYGFNGRVEWCACFVSWCYNQAGCSEPKFAACTSQGMPWFQSRGQWGDRNYAHIAPGDAIFFDWDGDGSADHVGIVIGTDGTNVYTVEGNSGDACKIRSYPLGSSVIRGYGLMNW